MVFAVALVERATVINAEWEWATDEERVAWVYNMLREAEETDAVWRDGARCDEWYRSWQTV